MIDIALVREKREWVKAQMLRLQDEAAANRIDIIVEVDQRRRALLTESESLQAWLNKLNKAVGRFRGNKQLPLSAQAYAASQAAYAIETQDYQTALDILTNPPAAGQGDNPAQALDQLTTSLKQLGEKQEALNRKVELVTANLPANELWIPNIPH